MKRFADRLREARVAAGMTQEQLALELGITKSSVSAWENNRETPSFRMLPQLCRLLRHSLDELICGIEGASPASNPALNIDEASLVARNPRERALLTRYRRLPAGKQDVLLELLKPVEPARRSE